MGRGKATLNGLLVDADDDVMNREEVVNLTADDKSEILRSISDDSGDRWPERRKPFGLVES